MKSKVVASRSPFAKEQHRLVSVLASIVFVLSLNSAHFLYSQAPVAAPGSPQAAAFEAEFIFPFQTSHNHAPSIVQFPGGDVLVCWYRGSGERRADDVAVYGSWKRSGSDSWTEPRIMADQPGFPDCNTCMYLGKDGKLFLFWPTIIANTWESCITRYRTAVNFVGEDAPHWTGEGIVLLKPDNFSELATPLLDEAVKQLEGSLSERLESALAEIRVRIGDKLYQRLGWQPRCKPTVLPSGRILLPLYSDTFSAVLMAISDDNGKTWFSSNPIIGFGNIQASVLRRNDGTLVAYMRENGATERIRVSESQDDGVNWSAVYSSSLPNPGSGLDAVRLENGDWVLVYNDTTEGRSSLAVSLSEDEGKSWGYTKHLERNATGAYHYPAVIQGEDRAVHVVYSYFTDAGKSMKYVRFEPSWIRE